MKIYLSIYILLIARLIKNHLLLTINIYNMNTLWITSRKKIVIARLKKGRFLFLIYLLLVTSCSKSDGIEKVINGSSSDTESTIIYTDIVPDFSSASINYYYNLDLNNDLIDDFYMGSYFNVINLFEINSIQESNNINACMVVNPFSPYTLPLYKDNEIFKLAGNANSPNYASMAYFIIKDCISGESECNYNWKDKKDNYLGLRFYIKGQTHYGWVRLDITSHTEWVIKDYAFNATPNSPILAGQKE